MRKLYLFTDLFDELFNMKFDMSSDNFPKENDPNFNLTVEESETDTHVIKNEIWKSIDGSQVYKRTTMQSKSKYLQKDIEQLKLEMKKAVESEDFETAAKLRDEIKSIKKGE